MSSSDPAPDRYYLFDTGPLLCFAGIPQGYDLLADRYRGRAGAISDVQFELKGLTNQLGPIGDAAKIAVNKYTWLEPYELAGTDELNSVEEARRRLQTFKPHRRREHDLAGTRKDWGECATLVLAEKLKGPDRSQVVVVVANEDAARELANADGIPTICAADIFQALVNDQQLTAKQAFRHCRNLTDNSFDVGDVVPSADYFR